MILFFCPLYFLPFSANCSGSTALLSTDRWCHTVRNLFEQVRFLPESTNSFFVYWIHFCYRNIWTRYYDDLKKIRSYFEQWDNSPFLDVCLKFLSREDSRSDRLSHRNHPRKCGLAA